MKEKLRGAFWAAAFFAGLLLCLAVLSAVFLPRDNRMNRGMEDQTANAILGEPAGTIDLVVLGDSETYHGIAPALLWEEYGIPAYIFSTGAQHMAQTEFYFRRAVEAQHPRAVIVQANPLFEEQTLGDVVMKRLEWMFPVLRYHDRWKTLELSEIFRKPEYTFREADKGYIPSTEIQPVEISEYLPYTEDAEPVPEVNRMVVRKIQQICEQEGIQLILAATPCVEYWYYEWHNGVAQMAEEYGIPFIDLALAPEEYTIDWSRDTMDGGAHLNNTGAAKVTRFLGDSLGELNILPDRRQDPAWAEWSEMDRIYAETFLAQ